MWAIDENPVVLPSDGLIPPIDADALKGYVAQQPLCANDTPEILRHVSAQPEPGGIRVSIVKFHQTEPALAGIANPNIPVHWHPTIDIRFIIAGECTLIMDSGEQVTARPGDCVISHSDSHTWRVDSREGCTFGIVMLGGKITGRMPSSGSRLTHADPSNVHDASE